MSNITADPRPVRIATLAIWAILGLLVLRTILTLVFTDELIDAYVADNETLKAMPRSFAENAAPRYTAVAIGVLIVGAVLVLAALNLGRAARWARVVAVVFAGLSLLGVVVSVIAPTIPVLLVINIVVGLLEIAVIVSLFTRDANQFFAR